MGRGPIRRTIAEYLQRKITLQIQRIKVEEQYLDSLKAHLARAMIEDESTTREDPGTVEEAD